MLTLFTALCGACDHAEPGGGPRVLEPFPKTNFELLVQDNVPSATSPGSLNLLLSNTSQSRTLLAALPRFHLNLTLRKIDGTPLPGRKGIGNLAFGPGEVVSLAPNGSVRCVVPLDTVCDWARVQTGEYHCQLVYDDTQYNRTAQSMGWSKKSTAGKCASNLFTVKVRFGQPPYIVQVDRG